MCEVCAVFGIGRHWSDAAVRASPTFAAPQIATYRDERRRRIALVNALVATHGVEVSDWDGEAFWITARGGRGELVPHLGALWKALERLAGTSFDPLAIEFFPSA